MRFYDAEAAELNNVVISREVYFTEKVSEKAMYLMLRDFVEKVFIILISPLVMIVSLFVAILLLFDIGYPLLFIQKRPGKYGIPFKLVKFRTMQSDDSDKKGGVSFERKKITAICQFIRKHRLDELPQFWNVLKGDMSIIGPRPDPYGLFTETMSINPDYKLRTLVKPGITGLAQVKYIHTTRVDQNAEKLIWDLKYIENLGLKSDLEIVKMTFSVLFSGNGAK